MGIASVAAESGGPPEHRAPAGQVCPRGSYVIGFDDEANILCSEACGNEVLNTGEACDDGNTTSGDGCSSTCQSEAGAGVAVIAVETTPVDQEGLPSIEGPVIESVKPWAVAYGTREVTITIHGTGFIAGSVVIFGGATYPATVNREGTQLITTIPTRNLAMGKYAVTVSNGPEMEFTLKKALEVY
jgi:cysteine-rich repeat protein